MATGVLASEPWMCCRVWARCGYKQAGDVLGEFEIRDWRFEKGISAAFTWWAFISNDWRTYEIT